MKKSVLFQVILVAVVCVFGSLYQGSAQGMEVEWVDGQVAGSGSIIIDQEDEFVTLTLNAPYGYTKIENVVIPANAVSAKISIVNVSANQGSGDSNLWRLRITHPDGSKRNIGGGTEAHIGMVEVVELPSEFLTSVESGLLISAIEFGGSWAFDESVSFKLEFLDSNGVSLSFFSQK